MLHKAACLRGVGQRVLRKLAIDSHSLAAVGMHQSLRQVGNKRSLVCAHVAGDMLYVCVRRTRQEHHNIAASPADEILKPVRT